jgi:outer membrane protein assembly factor BamB
MRNLCLLTALALTPLAAADDWPGWRGLTGLGQATASDLPLTWSATENVKWKAPLPDRGNASPAIWGDHIFLTQANRDGSKRGILCLDRKTGKEKWATYIEFRGKEPTHGTNPYGSATCVTDGERVITSLGSAGLLCLDFAGKELWRKDLGEFIHIWGNASSPILHGDNVILWCGPGERQFLVAFHKKTGDEVWRHEEPGGHAGLKKGDPWIGSWSTPVVGKVGGREELILSVPKKVKAFDPKTGKELWSCAGLTDLVYTSPVVSPAGIVVAMSGYGGSALAVRAGGSGDVTKTHRLWHHPRNPQRIGSAVIVGDHAYLINEPGRASCFELKTGKDVWDRDKLLGTTWGSFVHAAGRLYVTSNGGETVVLKADPKLEELARNRLPDQVLASIAVADDELFIRGYRLLWCVSAKK